MYSLRVSQNYKHSTVFAKAFSVHLNPQTHHAAIYFYIWFHMQCLWKTFISVSNGNICLFFFCLKSLCQNTMPFQTSLFKLMEIHSFSSFYWKQKTKEEIASFMQNKTLLNVPLFTWKLSKQSMHFKKFFSSNVALCFLHCYIHSYAHISQETLCVAGRVADPKCRHASRTEIGNRFIAGFAEHNKIRRLTGIK